MDENMMLSDPEPLRAVQQESKNNNNKPASNDFVRKLFSILESNQYPSIVRWSESGDCFMVLDTGKFTTQILPNHFKHSNFASFVRQLNKYDFHKIKRSSEEKQRLSYGEQSWEFENPNFKRHYEEGLDLIKRKTPAQKKVMLDETGAAVTQNTDPQNDVKLKNTLLNNTVRKDIFNNLKKRVDKLQREMHDVAMENYNMKAEHQRLSSKYDTLLNSLITFKTINENLINNFNILCNALTSKGVELPHSVYENLNISMPIPVATSPIKLSPSPSLALPLKNSAMSPPLPSMKSLQRTPSLAPKLGGPSQLDIGQSQLDSNTNNAETPDLNGLANSTKSQADQNVVLRKGFHVLLVEDDSVSIELCSKFLRKDGCTVQVVTDGLSAISNLEKFRYDLVLMDIVMPNLDGATATSIVRSFDNQTPIIAMTGNIEDQDLITYLQHGMNDILAKPFTRNDLHSILVRHLKDRIPLCDQNGGQQIKPESPNLTSTQQMLNLPQQNDNTTTSPLPQSLPPIQPQHQQSPLYPTRTTNITPLVPLNQTLSPQLPNIDNLSSNGTSSIVQTPLDAQPPLKKQHT